MRSAIPAVHCPLLFGAAGCGQADPPPSATPRGGVAHPAVAHRSRVVWTPSLVEDGYMFKDEAAFRAYVEGAEVVAVGTLAAWDGSDGRLRVERVLRGRAGAELPLRASGGLVRPAPGHRVIALLSSRDGGMALHSFCAAGGVYGFTEPLAAHVDGMLRGRPV